MNVFCRGSGGGGICENRWLKSEAGMSFLFLCLGGITVHGSVVLMVI